MIRKASAVDAKPIAKLMVAAMGDLANKFRGSEDQQEVLQLFEHFIGLSNNQYSFENTLVYIEREQIIGSITAYDGGSIKELRKPFLAYIKANYHPNGFEIEEETEDGEFYIDTLSVNPAHQGKSIGTKLLHASITWAKELGQANVGLLVNFANPNAKRLYERVGFIAKDVKTLKGKKYDHLVYELK